MMVLRQQGKMGKLSFFQLLWLLNSLMLCAQCWHIFRGKVEDLFASINDHDTRHIVILHKNVDFTVKSSCSDAKKHTDHFSHETCSDMT